MSSTFPDLLYHSVFSTKYRRRYVADNWREALFKYLGGTVTGLAVCAPGVGGTASLSILKACLISSFLVASSKQLMAILGLDDCESSKSNNNQNKGWLLNVAIIRTLSQAMADAIPLI